MFRAECSATVPVAIQMLCHSPTAFVRRGRRAQKGSCHWHVKEFGRVRNEDRGVEVVEFD